MKKININKQTKYSLEFIYNESCKMLESSLSGISETRNKSFILFALFSSVLSFSFLRAIEYDLEYLILVVGNGTSLIIIFKNLLSQNISLSGSSPKHLVVDYFNDFSGDELEKEYIATIIENHDQRIEDNFKVSDKMVCRYKKAIFCFLFTVFTFGVYFIFLFIKGIPC